MTTLNQILHTIGSLEEATLLVAKEKYGPNWQNQTSEVVNEDYTLGIFAGFKAMRQAIDLLEQQGSEKNENIGE